MSYVLLPQFAIFLSVIIIVEIAAAIAAYVFKDKVSAKYNVFIQAPAEVMA